MPPSEPSRTVKSFSPSICTLFKIVVKRLRLTYHQQGALNVAVKRGGAVAGEADRQILKQFCRGCWDNTLLSYLNLEGEKSRPPAFLELLLLICTEEDMQAVEALRMKKHLRSHWQCVRKILRVPAFAVNRQPSARSSTH